MKVGVIKLGSRISYGGKDTSGGNGEVRSVLRILRTAGINVHVFTKILEKDTCVANTVWHQIDEDYEQINSLGLDALIVLNGNVNFFGGAEDRSQILNYYLINNFKGKVFYILCDPALQLKQIWPSISKKPWAGSYKESDIVIKRKNITYISQPFRVDLLVKDILPKNGIDVHHAIYFPFEQFPCLNDVLPPVDLSELKADISYGGTMRGGKREKKMIDFYFGYSQDVDVEMFGKIELKDFNPKRVGNLRPPRFSGTVKYDDFLPKMNTALSTVVIGDPLYEQLEDINQRVYESIWSNVVTFIDNEFDINHRVFGHDEDLSEFLYVKNRAEVEERVNVIKNEPDVRLYILEKQIKAVNFDKHKYSAQLKSIIKENLL
jgi:hypothetical protein